MDKDKSKGLADSQDGEFILNESGTSVTVDFDANFSKNENQENVNVEEKTEDKKE